MIAIAGGKGGCGKTTTTLGTARALAAMGLRTRAVDLDAGMPNLHRMAGVERDPSLTALAESATGAGTHVSVQRDECGAEIVPAPRALGDVDLGAALDAVRPRDGVGIVDCPAGAGPAATAPLRASDAAILVTTSRPESVEDAAKTGRMARNLGVPILGAVVTRTERVSRAIEADLATGRALAVPHSRTPLGDGRVRECYGTVASWVETLLRSRRRETAPAGGRPPDGGTASRAGARVERTRDGRTVDY